jgi:FkbM family methyltransferase
VDSYFYLDAFERETIYFYKKLLNGNLTVFDIGGNIGIFSLIAASHLQDNSQIYAFEPAERAWQTFKKNIQLNSFENISLQKLGVSDKSEWLTFHICNDDAYNSIGDKPMQNVIYSTKIKVISIDEFCLKNKIDRIDLLKIDTEGAESKVLAGGKHMLSQDHSPIIFCEYNRNVQSFDKLNRLEYLLHDYGYELYYLHFGILRKFQSESKTSDIIALKYYHFSMHNI